MPKNNSSFHGYKTLLEALETIQSEGVKAKKFLADKRLTNQEKRLLDFYLRVRANDFSLINDLLQDSSFDNADFLRGLKYYFLGVAFVYKSDSTKAEEFLKMSLPFLNECHNEKFARHLVFKAHVNIFYAYVNQKRITEMQEKLREISLIKRERREDDITFKQMELCCHLLTEDYLKAEEAIEELSPLMSVMTDIERMTFLIDKFDFFIKMDLYGKAREVFKEMRNYRTFRLSANYQYMDKLLKFFMDGERIYAYDRDFADHEDLYLMINVIKSLDEADDFQALHYWRKLSQNSPKTFKGEFDYQGDKCLFSVCLMKCLERASGKMTLVLKASYTDHEKRLIELIQNAPGHQLRKETLYESFYGKKIAGKDDLAALAALIYRINKKGEILIKSKSGSYFLIQEEVKTA